MRRFLKRLPLVFAVSAVTFVVAVWVAVRVIATNVITERTEPVRKQLEGDWSAHVDALLRDLQATQVWAEPGGAVPVETGCHLRWTPAGHPAVKRHLERCKASADPLPKELRDALGKLADGALAKEAELPAFALDLGWMTALRERGDWLEVQGTALEFVDRSPESASALGWPLLEPSHVRNLATLRLVAGQRAGALDEAVLDVTALGRALLGRPVVSEQLVGLGVLQHLRAQLDAAGHVTAGPAKDFLGALRRGRFAASQVWHPWVPQGLRARVLPALPAASRCAAAAEALVVRELGDPLRERYPEFDKGLADWLAAPRTCESTFLAEAHAARAKSSSWQRFLEQAATLEGQEPAGRGLLGWVIERSPHARGAALETVLAVMTAKPFPGEGG